MKKKLMILFLIVVGSSMCIFGCGNQNSPKQEVVKEETLGKRKIASTCSKSSDVR